MSCQKCTVAKRTAGEVHCLRLECDEMGIEQNPIACRLVDNHKTYGAEIHVVLLDMLHIRSECYLENLLCQLLTATVVWMMDQIKPDSFRLRAGVHVSHQFG